MNALLALLTLLLSIGILIAVPDGGAAALLVGACGAGLVGLLISRTGSNGHFLLRLFVSALLLRVLIGTIIYTFHLQEFFGPMSDIGSGHTIHVTGEDEKLSPAQAFIDV